MAQAPGPGRQVQIAHIATQHYLQNKTRIEIANETGLSRFKVARLLEEAVSSGIVRIDIQSPSGVRLDLSVQLAERFKLDHSVVVDVPSADEQVLQARLGSTVGDLLSEILTDDDVLGLTSGRTLSTMARSLKTLPKCGVVQLAGVAGPIQETGLEIMRRVSSIAGVRPWTIYSPLVMSDAQAALGVRRQPDTAQTFDQFPRVTVAVGAVGSWQPENSQMIKNRALSEADRTKLLERGVVAEFGATLIADSGEVIHDIDDRCIAISEAGWRAIPTVIAAAGGPSKTRAIRALLASGLIHGLVTDSGTAERLLGG
ncbi:sugar-binding domain-containing protein [Arthrobacter sp. efr-133-R2A-120]|uniref:sugar-binding transcriptional regulator n=1 Tax=Arthrobacter sp. efr-133-R2A-120 TaxID=3040277 RepID=UPI00254EDAED|nr:sugar-binding domain-containing protein [Arthrobacter sp. efr-133-R2A-120]